MAEPDRELQGVVRVLAEEASGLPGPATALPGRPVCPSLDAAVPALGS